MHRDSLLHSVVLRTHAHSSFLVLVGASCVLERTANYRLHRGGIVAGIILCLYLIWRKLLSFAPDKFKPGNLECEIIKVLAPLAACVVLRKQSAAAISTQQNAYCDMPSTNQRLRVQGNFFGPSTCVFYVAAYIRTHFSAYLFVAC
jgi:hypothetical protein